VACVDVANDDVGGLLAICNVRAQLINARHYCQIGFDDYEAVRPRILDGVSQLLLMDLRQLPMAKFQLSAIHTTRTIQNDHCKVIVF
jgi:hypothetical protein